MRRAWIILAGAVLTASGVARAEDPQAPSDAPPAAVSGDPAPAAGPSDAAPAAQDQTPDPAPEPEPWPALETRFTGFLDSRITVQRPVWEGLLPTTNVPALANVTELDFQQKLSWGDRATLFGDFSFIEQGGGNYYGADADGNAKALGAHDNPNLRPLAVVSELYGTWLHGDHLNVTIGKKRLVWGPGFSVNPTDVLNPPKDPTDPAFQRAGAWLGRVELPYDDFTISIVGAMKVLRQYGGLPSALLYWPDYPSYETVTSGAADARDGQPHFAAVARLYALVADTDVNLLYSFTNLYNDAFEHKNRIGVSASHVWGGWELHAEVLGQLGNPRPFVNADCVATLVSLRQCLQQKPAELAPRSLLDDTTPVVKGLVGARYTFEDNAMLQLEYYFNGEGYTRTEHEAYVTGLVRAQQQQAALAGTPGGAIAGAAMAAQLAKLTGQGSVDPGNPQKFTFDQQRRHYAFLTWQQPQWHDDFTVNLVLLLNLEDLSGQLAPSLAWSAREWLTLTVGGFVPLPGLESQAIVVDGGKYTEYGLLPSDWRGYVAARLFY